MSLFVKIWTDIEYDDWFLGLSCLQRGVWLQLIVLAKNRGNSGEISFRSYRALAENLGLDRGTLKKSLRLFADSSHLVLEELPTGVVQIKIPKYLYYQEFKTGKEKPESGEKSAKIPHPIEKSREENIREENINTNVATQHYDQGSSCRYTPEEELRREDLSRIVEIIAKWDCMHREANPYGIAGQIYKTIGRDVDFVLQVLKERADYLQAASSSGHLIASVLALKQKDYNWRDIESRAHKEAASE